MTKLGDRIQGHCPKCGADRWADVVGHHQHEWDYDLVWGINDYRILKCRGCENIYFQTEKVFSEEQDYRRNPVTDEWEAYLPSDFSYWPAPSKRERPKWASDLSIDYKTLGGLLDEVYGALNNDLRVLAAIGVRTVLDAASELLEVDPAKTFEEKIVDLVRLGKVGQEEKKTLDALANAGNAAAHRKWKPEPEELDAMVSVIEAFLYRNFVLGKVSAKLDANNIPAKTKRVKKPKAQDENPDNKSFPEVAP